MSVCHGMVRLRGPGLFGFCGCRWRVRCIHCREQPVGARVICPMRTEFCAVSGCECICLHRSSRAQVCQDFRRCCRQVRAFVLTISAFVGRCREFAVCNIRICVCMCQFQNVFLEDFTHAANLLRCPVLSRCDLGCAEEAFQIHPLSSPAGEEYDGLQGR